jgi:hypothetical protein
MNRTLLMAIAGISILNGTMHAMEEKILYAVTGLVVWRNSQLNTQKTKAPANLVASSTTQAAASSSTPLIRAGAPTILVANPSTQAAASSSTLDFTEADKTPELTEDDKKAFFASLLPFSKSPYVTATVDVKKNTISFDPSNASKAEMQQAVQEAIRSRQTEIAEIQSHLEGFSEIHFGRISAKEADELAKILRADRSKLQNELKLLQAFK